jgi:mRNA-degrading endonuclease toxin of MazEF toxin-antitoxin module
MTTALRGQVYSVDVGGNRGRHYFVIVSNNQRNRSLKSVLGVMVTSTDKSGIASAVQLTYQDPVQGYVVADIIEELWEDEVDSPPTGHLSRQTMTALDEALRIALGLP